MTDYSKMSDQDISKKVGDRLELEWANLDENYNKLCYWKAGIGPLVFAPCNNPADAWPIIHDNLISIEFDNDGYTTPRSSWCKTSTPRGDVYYGFEKEPLRAAMIVFLMMKDAEHENPAA